MKKTMSMALAGVLSLASVFAAGCGKKSVPDTATDIEITFWRSGMGDAYIKEIEKAFEAKYPEYEVHTHALLRF